ncbi:MAG: SUMF1/EgtB/PvdO family nonheme iron enzyme [Parachlamydiaceae bacterium]|nr:SUMF1/EgtB/PvdO family nonheme iron enzyme [Parachlamydiaceae bacterium]
MTIIYRFLLLCILAASSCIAEEVLCGTLIVCYQTGPKEERLDRIRFRLQNSQYEGQLYPKKTALMTGDKCQHRHVVIENLPIGKYTLKFLVPNLDHYFDEVPERSFELHPAEVIKVNQFIRPRQAVFKESDKFSLVEAGQAIIGDSFSETAINALPAAVVEVPAFLIGIYEITNAEYARWLNQAVSEGEITYTAEGDAQGTVFDREGHVLCKTKEREPLSQLSYRMIEGHVHFSPIIGKEDFPVIFVSWYGADLYSRSNGWRLPSEAEWEKAASMEIRENSFPLRKFRFGFSRDEIDLTWANYKNNDTPIENNLVHTAKVGYFNGTNTNTQDAKSPYGAYDMSGNVWEWVSDFFRESDSIGPKVEESKIVKGGCYDSLASGVRTAERLALPLSHTDAFTGFRVAANKRVDLK